MSVVQAEGRRRGRDARVAARGRPLEDAARPVWPGLKGGRFKPLAEADILKIHHAVLDVLEQIGFADAIPSCIEAVTAIGGITAMRPAALPARAG